MTSLADEWDRYLASVPIEGYDRDRLAGMGRQFLQQVEEEARQPMHLRSLSLRNYRAVYRAVDLEFFDA